MGHRRGRLRQRIWGHLSTFYFILHLPTANNSIVKLYKVLQQIDDALIKIQVEGFSALPGQNRCVLAYETCQPETATEPEQHRSITNQERHFCIRMLLMNRTSYLPIKHWPGLWSAWLLPSTCKYWASKAEADKWDIVVLVADIFPPVKNIHETELKEKLERMFGSEVENCVVWRTYFFWELAMQRTCTARLCK